jgi:hypothetical protein
MTKAPKLGDRVIIDFGGFEKEAEVVRISDIFTPPEVEVEFKLDEHDDFTMRNMYPIDMIRPAPARAA